MIVMPCYHTDNVFFFLFPGYCYRHDDAVVHGENRNSFEGNSSRFSGSSRMESSRMASTEERPSFRNFYEKDLESLLATESGVKRFSEHCAKEFSMENIRFWQAINQFRGSAATIELESNGENKETLHDMAEAIFEEYVEAGSDMQVNVPDAMVVGVEAVIVAREVKHGTFDDCQTEVFNLMSRDSYQRYMQSKSKADGKERRKSVFEEKSRRWISG